MPFGYGMPSKHVLKVIGAGARSSVWPTSAYRRGKRRHMSGGYGVTTTRGSVIIPRGLLPESKFLNTVIASTAVGTNGTYLSDNLCLVPEGVKESQRIGRKITVTSVHIKGTLLLVSTTDVSETSDHCRIIVGINKQTNGIQAPLIDLVSPATAGIFSHRNVSNMHKFRILSDKMFTINSTCGAGDATVEFGEVRRYYHQFHKISVPIEYDDSVTTGAIASQDSKSIFICGWTASTHILFSGTVRIRYTG